MPYRDSHHRHAVNSDRERGGVAVAGVVVEENEDEEDEKTGEVNEKMNKKRTQILLYSASIMQTKKE